jgi:hypothetical protein
MRRRSKLAAVAAISASSFGAKDFAEISSRENPRCGRFGAEQYLPIGDNEVNAREMPEHGCCRFAPRHLANRPREHYKIRRGVGGRCSGESWVDVCRDLFLSDMIARAEFAFSDWHDGIRIAMQFVQ